MPQQPLGLLRAAPATLLAQLWAACVGPSGPGTEVRIWPVADPGFIALSGPVHQWTCPPLPCYTSPHPPLPFPTLPNPFHWLNSVDASPLIWGSTGAECSFHGQAHLLVPTQMTLRVVKKCLTAHLQQCWASVRDLHRSNAMFVLHSLWRGRSPDEKMVEHRLKITVMYNQSIISSYTFPSRASQWTLHHFDWYYFEVFVVKTLRRISCLGPFTRLYLEQVPSSFPNHNSIKSK